MLQAGTIVVARFFLRKKIPSDGKWRASFVMGIAQALLYPTLITYLSFVLPQSNRNVLIGLFIAMADLGVSMGGVIMGPVADISSFTFMYMICALLGGAMIIFAYERREIFAGSK